MKGHIKDVANQKMVLDLVLSLSASARGEKKKFLYLHDVYAAFKKAGLAYKNSGGIHDGETPKLLTFNKIIKNIVMTFAVNAEKNGVAPAKVEKFRVDVKSQLLRIKEVPASSELVDDGFITSYLID